MEVETAFGFGALLRREKKKKSKMKKKKEKRKNSPHVTDGNFSGPTMLQSISLHSDFLLLFKRLAWSGPVELGFLFKAWPIPL